MSLVHLEPQDRIGHWINGRLDPGVALRTAPVFDPAQGRAVRTALDQVLCDPSARLHEGCELAFFPPVTGG